MWANELAKTESADRHLVRRLRLGILSEQLPEIVSPAQGVLFLRRIGIDVHYELRDAVATVTMREYTDDAMRLYRQLMGLPPKDAEPDDVLSTEESESKSASEPKRPQQAREWQEHEILRVISEFGLTASALPKPPPGKRGVKAQVKERLKMSDKVFNLAWERLRGDKRIADETLPQAPIP